MNTEVAYMYISVMLNADFRDFLSVLNLDRGATHSAEKTMVIILLTEEVTEHVRYSYLWHNACILFAADFVGIYLVTYSTFFSTRTELRYLMTVCQLHIPVLFAKDAMIMCSERK